MFGQNEQEEIRLLRLELAELKKEHEDLEDVEFLLFLIYGQQKKLYKLLNQPNKLDVLIGGEMDGTFQVGQVVPISVVERLADGSVFQHDPANINYQVQDSSIVSIGPDPNDPTGVAKVATMLAVGSTGVAAQDTVTGVSGTATVTVNAITQGPTSLEIVFGTPSSAAAKKV